MRTFALFLASLLTCLAASPDPGRGRTMGNPRAPLLLELYTDFMCPHCKTMEEKVLPAIILDYVKTGKAYLIFREYPLAIPQHVYSRPAAALAVAAARAGKFQIVNDALFRNQDGWSATGKVWDTVAGVLTADERKQVQAIANDPTVMAEVQEDVRRGMAMRVTQTPTLMVTYKLKSEPWTQFGDYQLLRGYLDALLKK